MPRAQLRDKSDCLLVCRGNEDYCDPACFLPSLIVSPSPQSLPGCPVTLSSLGDPVPNPTTPLRLFHTRWPSVPTLYSRDPGGPLVLKIEESSGINTEQKAAVLQQVKAEWPRCQDDFIGSFSHGQLHTVVITARDREPGKEIKHT